MPSTNPYEGNEKLSRLEADVLWEYAKLAENMRQLVALTKEAGVIPTHQFTVQMHNLERKIGLVMTLFKGSLWAVMNDRWEAEQTTTEPDSFAEGDLTITR